MESAVNSLNTYLTAAREQTDEPNEQFGALVKERVLLAQRIKELEQQSEVTQRQTAEITHLREVKYIFNIIIRCYPVSYFLLTTFLCGIIEPFSLTRFLCLIFSRDQT